MNKQIIRVAFILAVIILPILITRGAYDPAFLLNLLLFIGTLISRLLHNKDKEKLSTPDIMELKAYVNLSETYIYDLKMSFSLP